MFALILTAQARKWRNLKNTVPLLDNRQVTTFYPQAITVNPNLSTVKTIAPPLSSATQQVVMTAPNL